MSRWLLVLVICLAPAAAHAQLQLSSTFLNFFGEADGFAQTQSVTVRNGGREPVRLSVYNSCYREFRVSSQCYSRLQPGQSCWIQVTFDPRQKGYYSCSISLSSDRGDRQTVQVSGTAR